MIWEGLFYLHVLSKLQPYPQHTNDVPVIEGNLYGFIELCRDLEENDVNNVPVNDLSIQSKVFAST